MAVFSKNVRTNGLSRFLGTATRGLVCAGLLLTANDAWALSCDEIMSLVGYNIPTDTIVSTIEGSGDRYTSEDVSCLTDRGAPEAVIASVRKLVKGSTTDDEPMRRPPPDPEPDEDDGPSFDRSDTLSSDLSETTDEELEGGDRGPERLEDLIRLYRSKKLLTASKGLYDLLDEDIYPEHESKIKYYLAKSLYDLGMYHSAQFYFMEVVRKGPRNPFFKYALPKMVAIAQLTGNDTELLRIVHKIPPEAFPRQAKNHLHYLMGRKLYEKGELSASAKYFQQISQRSELYMRSKYFEGIIHNERGKLKSSVKAFRDVYQAEVDATDQRTAAELKDLKELALIDIARIYYALERYDNADNYYGLVDHSSMYWPEALFERAWTNFMLNDLNDTLGLLLTVNSPYYADEEFIPEATILRALTFFQLCNYDEVEKILLDFEASHRPMRTEIKTVLDQYADEETQKLSDQVYEQYFEKEDARSALPKSFFLRLLRNRDLSAIVRHLGMMDEEVGMIEAQKGIWADSIGSELKQIIERDRTRYKKRAGLIILQDMAMQYDYLGSLLTQSEIIRFEVVDAQRLDYEYKMQNPMVESASDRTVDFATSRDIIYWPFNGEFWRDELGYYRYTETPNCK